MIRISKTVLIVVLCACATERSEPSDRMTAQPQAANAPAGIDTPLTQSALVTAPDSFVYQRNWSRADSIVGEFIRLSHLLAPSSDSVASDTVRLPGGVRIGRTTTGTLKALLGEPASENPEYGTLLLQYDSPFIGPDEAVIFHMKGDILRKISWTLYSD
jgi:hypothetical protein